MKFNRRYLLIPGHLLSLLALWFTAPAPAETAIEAWVQRCPGGPDVSARVDGNNNIIVAGSGGDNAGGFLTIKYSSSGSPLWTNRYDVSTNSSITYASGLAVDRSNNVIVTGRSSIFGGGAEFDYATVKYSSAGVPLWTNRYSGNPGSTSGDYATGIAVDSSNNVIVTGYSQNAALNYDFLTIKYSSEGLPLWTNRYDGPLHGDDEARAVAVDGNDNIIVTGYTGSSANVFSEDFLTLAYSSAGVPLWTNVYNGPANSIDTASVITVDSNNNVIVAGQSDASQVYPYDPDWLIIKYSVTGTPLWTNRYAQSLSDIVTAMIADGGNNVIVAGSCGTDYVTIKYSSAGAPLWTNRYNYGINGGNPSQAIAVDSRNNIAVAGFSKAGALHFETIKYSSAGVPLWTNDYNAVGNYLDGVQAVAGDRNDDFIVTGYSSTASFELVTIKYAILGRPPVLQSGVLTNGGFQVCAEGYSLPGKLLIEVSSDLLEWLPVFTNSTATNLTFYTDTDTGGRAFRFYRAVLLP